MAAIERAVPQNVEAEEAVLGSILIDDNALYKVASFLRPEHFYVGKNGQIFQAFLSVSERHDPVDVLTVCDELERQEQLQEVGGAAYVTSLLNAVPTAIHVEHYARLVERTAVLRQLIAAAGEIARIAYEETGDADEALDQAERVIFDIAQGRVSGDFLPLSQILATYLEQLDRVKEGEATLGLPTGFADLDKLTGGLQQGDLIIVAARPSVGKCLSFDSEIVLEDGSIATIEELYRRRRARLFSLNENWKLGFTEPSDFIDNGFKPVFKTTTNLGRTVETTAAHPFLTINGWKPLSELGPGDRIAVPRQLGVFGEAAPRSCEVKLLAYLIGDGGLTRSVPKFTNGNPEIQRDFLSAIDEFGGVVAITERPSWRTTSWRVVADPDEIVQGRKEFAERLGKTIAADGRSHRKVAQLVDVSPSAVCHWTKGKAVPRNGTFTRLCDVLGVQSHDLAPDGHARMSKNSKNSLTVWLENIELWGKNSHQKTIPSIVFRLRRDLLALFLNRLFATDGWATVRGDGGTEVGYASVSEKLVRQVQHLLLRFGIVSSIRRKAVKYRGTHRFHWQLTISHVPSTKAFISSIGIYGKDDVLSDIETAIDKRARKPNRDTIPLGVWSRLAESKGDESWVSLARRVGIRGASNIHAGKRRLSRGRLAALANALGDASLQELADSDVYWDEIVSIVPSGRKQVYDLVIPGTHNFVANDICVHNTALAVNIAHHAAVRERAPVAVFSLEMSHEQLAHRLLCAEASIDSQRLRLGQYDEDELRRISRAFGVLSEAPIYVDDTAGISVTELRSKARRLYLERGIRLIIIDYLQLMRGRRAESRVQEISDISRSLKGLAKELDVPVVALSQLSRAPELRSDHRPILSDLRESGCLTGDTLVQLSDGHRVPIAQLARDGHTAKVQALNETTWKLEPAAFRKAWCTGSKPVFKLQTRLGREIRASGNHQFLTATGWKRLDHLRPGVDHVALPRSWEGLQVEEAAMTGAEVALLGHMLGDGCTLPRHAVQYTTANRELADLVVDLAEEMFGGSVTPRVERQRQWWQVFLSASEHLTHGVRNPVATWLEDLGVWGLRSYEKHVPARLFVQPSSLIRRFLRHLWSTDGTLGVFGKKNPRALALYASSSQRLALDVQHLLLRLGITARVRRVPQPGRGRDQWHTVITGKPNLMGFVEYVGTLGPKQARLEEIRDFYRGRDHNPNNDTIPVAFWHSLVEPARQAIGMSQRDMQAAMGMQYCGTTLYKSGLSRERAARVGQIVRSDNLLHLSQSDVYWDKVVAIEPDGNAEVYDLEVPGHHNFVAGDVVVHNSIEQDADVVVFIYREELYDPETEKQGIADILVAKHRNGPIGNFGLYFFKETTRFANLQIHEEPV